MNTYHSNIVYNCTKNVNFFTTKRGTCEQKLITLFEFLCETLDEISSANNNFRTLGTYIAIEIHATCLWIHLGYEYIECPNWIIINSPTISWWYSIFEHKTSFHGRALFIISDTVCGGVCSMEYIQIITQQQKPSFLIKHGG